MAITIREYKTGDAENIFRFFGRLSSYKRDAGFWIWINRMLSEEPSLVVVAENQQGEIVGHYGIIPRNLWVDGKLLKAGHGLHVIVDPSCANELSVFQLSFFALKLAKEKQYDFLFGFPNKNYRLVLEKIERWKTISLFNAFVKDVKSINGLNGLLYDWCEILPHDYEKLLDLNNLLEREKIEKLSFNRSFNYLLNRYINHPFGVYKSYLLKKNNLPVGFVVTKLFKSELNSAHIVDFILPNIEDEQNVLNDFELMFHSTADQLVLWQSGFNNLSLKNLGYTENGFDTCFAVKIINPEKITHIDRFLLFQNWQLFMGDSDAI